MSHLSRVSRKRTAHSSGFPASIFPAVYPLMLSASAKCFDRRMRHRNRTLRPVNRIRIHELNRNGTTVVGQFDLLKHPG